MEDGDDNQRRSQDHKSILSTLLDGAENIKKVMDFADSVMKSETIDMKVNRMKRKFEVLESREKDINEELKYAESLSLRRRSNEVENWLKGVDEIKAKVRRVEQQVQESKEKWLPSLQLPGNLDRLTAEIVELNDQCEFSRGLTLEAQQSRGLEFPTMRLFGRMFQENKEMILEFLKDDNVLSIGVYGMGGVGKTTLLTHINNELVNNFQDMSVSWVTVSQKFTIYKLQENIARALGFSFCEEDVKKRAAELSKFLSRRKNFVLILDDVWKDINLDEIGISLRVNGCKMLLTTRSLDVCRKMDCQKQIKVVPLGGKDAWDLFSNKLGDDVELTPGIVEVAKSLVRECDGLPLGIITMARSMKQVDNVYEWKNALENVRDSKLEHDDMEEKVFQVLKYSYDMLRDQKVQQCFLDCSLYPEDHNIEREVLIDQFIDERLIAGMKSRQAEIRRGQTILNKLVNACLLEKIGHGYVKMHDLVRDMALQITSTSPRFLVQAGVGMTAIPDEDEWAEDLVKVSLMKNNFSNILVVTSSPSPCCPKVSALMLSFNQQLECISDCFFEHMIGLNVLDLSYTNIERLPASTCGLVNLSALLLKGCERLKSLPSLAKLQALRRLDISDSGIIKLPLGLEVLSKLRYLNLLTSFLQIQPRVLSMLVRLQFLGINLRYSKKVRVICEELNRLKRLEILEVHLNNVDGLNTYVKFFEEQELVNYICEVGFNQRSSLINTEYTKSIIIWKSEIHNSASWDQPLLLPQDIQSLSIENCNMVRSLSEATSLDKITNLRTCVISACEAIENLLNASLFRTSPLLQTLENLTLYDLKDFRGLINDDGGVSSLPPPGTLTSLKFISISNCPRIKKLFTPAFISLFQNLERMVVFECDQMEEIIGASSDGNEEGSSSRGRPRISLPKLTSLDLRVLNRLKSFCDGQTTLVADSLSEIHIRRCQSLKKLSFLDAEMCLFPSLQKIFVDEDWWNSLEWDHPGAEDVLRPLCHFKWRDFV